MLVVGAGDYPCGPGPLPVCSPAAPDANACCSRHLLPSPLPASLPACLCAAEGKQRDPTEMAQQILELLDDMGYLRWVPPACLPALGVDMPPGLLGASCFQPGCTPALHAASHTGCRHPQCTPHALTPPMAAPPLPPPLSCRDPAMPTLTVASALQRKHSDGILDFSML